jgi:hypothetical protein
MKKILLFITLAFAVAWANAQENFTDGVIRYYITGATTVEVRGNSYSFTGAANIPSTVTYNSVNYTVTSIGNSAFYYSTGLTSVTIPSSVTSIGEDAFHNCTGLTSVTIPNSVTSIGNYAFVSCSGLESVIIPTSVTSIGNAVFYSCTNLVSVDIPTSVTSIGSHAFYNCTGLTSVTIPNSVTSIGNYAFVSCSGLESLIIPTSVTSLGNSVFAYCSGLTSVSIPNSVTSLGNSVFAYCSGLTSISIPSSVVSIGSQVFRDCLALTSVTVAWTTPLDISTKELFVKDTLIEGYEDYVIVPYTVNNLYVPAGTSTAYDAAPKWTDFVNIIEPCTPTANTLQIFACDSAEYNGEIFTSSTTFNDTLENVGGCDSVLTVEINIFNSPVISAQPSDVTVCEDGIGIFTLEASNATFYQWQYAYYDDLDTWTDITGQYTETMYNTDSMVIGSLLEGEFDDYYVRALVASEEGCEVFSNAAYIDVLTPETWYLDADNDSYYGATKDTCTSPGIGWTTNSMAGEDCNDANADVHFIPFVDNDIEIGPLCDSGLVDLAYNVQNLGNYGTISFYDVEKDSLIVINVGDDAQYFINDYTEFRHYATNACGTSDTVIINVEFGITPKFSSISTAHLCQEGITTFVATPSNTEDEYEIYWMRSQLLDENEIVGIGESFETGTLTGDTTFYVLLFQGKSSCFGWDSTTVTFGVPSEPTVTNIVAFEEYQYESLVIVNDTTIYESYTNVTGCDSIIEININITNLAGDVDGNDEINDGEIAGDVDGDMFINTFGGEIAGDINGDGEINNDEIAGDLNGDEYIGEFEFAGDRNGEGILGLFEVAGDLDGNGIIEGNETAGDVNGNGIIDGNEVSGDINGSGSIFQTNYIYGGGEVTILEFLGDRNGNSEFDSGEIAGDFDGNGVINDPEIAGDADGVDGIVDPEFVGDVNGNGELDENEIEGDANGDGEINNGEVTAIFSSTQVETITLYPNPATENKEVSLSSVVSSYTLLNASGIEVANGSNTDKVSISGLAKGLYILKTANQSIKLVIE